MFREMRYGYTGYNTSSRQNYGYWFGRNKRSYPSSPELQWRDDEIAINSNRLARPTNGSVAKARYKRLSEMDRTPDSDPDVVKQKMQFTESAFYDIINTIGSRKAESGGLLFGNEEDFVVRKFVFDRGAKTTAASYTFNIGFLNPEIKRLWEEEGLSCLGFIHSHPFGYSRPSPPDMYYFTDMFQYMPREQYLVPIVFTVPDGGFKINAHILPNGAKETTLGDIEILPDNYFMKAIKPGALIDTPTTKPTKENFKSLPKFDTKEIIFLSIASAAVLGSSLLLFLRLFTNYLGGGR